MTNERVLGIILILSIIGAGIYLTFSRFKQDIAFAPSPSPSPAVLDFTLMNPPISQPSQQNQLQSPQTASNWQDKLQSSQPQPSQLPLSKNKQLSQFPGILKQEVLQNSDGQPGKKAVIVTKKGVIEFAVYPEASISASNFLILAANGFYDGLKFHRVEPGFVIQGGDPLGDGTGGPGYTFPDEPVTREYKKGTVAMANAGPDTNGSQFFIMLADHPELPKKYTIFGQVISGQDVVEKIAAGDMMEKVIIQNLK